MRQSIERGEFDNLPNAGQPIDLEEYFAWPEEVRVAYSVLLGIYAIGTGDLVFMVVNFGAAVLSLAVAVGIGGCTAFQACIESPRLEYPRCLRAYQGQPVVDHKANGL